MKFLNLYKTNGVRSFTDVQHPKVIPTQQFVLPTDSITHYLDFGSLSIGPSAETSIIANNIDNGLYLQDVFELSSLLGNPKASFGKIKPQILKHYRSIEGIHKVTSGLSSIPGNNPILVNYNPTNLAYTYRSPAINQIYKWSNIIRTALNAISTDTSNKPHLLYVHAPLDAYPDSWYDQFNKYNDRKLAGTIPGPYSYFALQINKWMSGKSSLFSAYDQNTLSKLTIGWHAQGQLILVSFEVLLAFNDQSVDEGLLLSVMPKSLSKSSRADVVGMMIRELYKNPLVQPEVEAISDDTVDETTLYDVELSAEDVEAEITAAALININASTTPIESTQQKLDELSDSTGMKATKYKTLTKKIEASKALVSPYDDAVTVAEYIKTDPKDAILPQVDQLSGGLGIPDTTMLRSTLVDYDKQYIRKLNKKHIARSIQAIQQAGVIVTDHKVETSANILGASETHIIKVHPIEGSPSTVRFTLPVVADDGTYMSNGTTYRLKKQRIDLPIRKIGPGEVALGTDYGKLFIRRSVLAVNNEGLWLKKVLLKRAFDENDPLSVVQGNVFDHLVTTPLIYSKLAQSFRSIQLGSIHLHFDKTTRSVLLRGKEKLSEAETKNRLLVGTLAQGYILMDKEGDLWKTGKGDAVPLGTIYDLLALDYTKAAKDLSTVAIFGRTMPIVILLGYHLGLSQLIKLLKVKIVTLAPRKRVPIDAVMKIVFENVTVVVMEASHEAQMILQGLVKLVKITKTLSYNDVKSPKGDGYGLLLEDGKTSTGRYIKEFDLLKDLYIDPLSKEVLEGIKEPTVFIPLVLRAVELLKDDQHPITTDGNYIRTRGYERLSGTVYKEMVTAIRGYRGRPDGRRKVIEVPPYAIWGAILQDNTNKPTEEINPIASLKQSEIVTYTGQGGRSRETMTAPSRRFSENDTGVLSEATPDSGDTGINAYLSPNPMFTNVYGVNGSTVDDPTINQTSSYSTSYLLSPGASMDSPSRINFINIQNSHVVSCKGARPPIVRTGYEYVLPYRTNSLYAQMAEQPGRVDSVTDDGIIITYKDGTKSGVRLGRQYGASEGAIYPHPIMTPLKAKQSFKKGDPIAYNSAFFEPDFLVPGQLIFKQGTSIDVALVEGMLTYEDSCAVSSRMVEPLSTQTVKALSYTLSFDDNVHKLISIGTKVNIGDSLFIIEDAISAQTNVFSDDNIDTLAELSSQAPKAKYKGTIDRIEVKYHGEIGEMSPTIAKITRAANKLARVSIEAAGKTSYSGQVTSEYRVKGKPLQLGSIEIKIYILRDHGISNGDKFVFGSQLKATVSKVINEKMTTTSGKVIDGVFSYRAMAARQVHSPVNVGAYATVMIELGKKLAAEYKQ